MATVPPGATVMPDTWIVLELIERTPAEAVV